MANSQESPLRNTSNLHDVIVIGAGVIGCSIARVLSCYDLSTLVIEKCADVASGTSGRNSAVIHAGFNNKPGTLMAKLCVEGNRRFGSICEELHVPYRKTGKLVVSFNEQDTKTLQQLLEQGLENKCEGLEIIDGAAVEKLLPGTGAVAALLSPNTAIISPFQYVIATAEHAADNGVVFSFDDEVTNISHRGDYWEVKTAKDLYKCKVIVNCAGLWSDKVASLAGVRSYHIYPCRGEYLILDRHMDDRLSMPIYPAPQSGAGGLGVHLTPTIEGNVIVGPSARYISNREDYATTKEITTQLYNEAQQLLPSLQMDVIGAYSGIRPKQTSPRQGGFKDFVICDEPTQPGLINLIGIESPGLTASMPLAELAVQMIGEHVNLEPKRNIIPPRRRYKPFRELDWAQQQQLASEDPAYREIICRCQQVTKRELINAIDNPLGVKSISGIKYRTWATTGRCQGGYCLTRIISALRESGIELDRIRLREQGSELFTGVVK